MHAALKSDPWSDFVALLVRIVNDPALFLGPTTGQTAGLDLTTILLITVQVILIPKPELRLKYQRAVLKYLGLLLPIVVLINVGMVVGSAWVSIYLFTKFQTSLPVESWKQLWSGVGHIAIPVLVIAICWYQIKRGNYAKVNWGAAWIAANLYWLYQLVLNTPPWLGFQEQTPVLLGTCLTGVGLSSVASLMYLLPRLRSKSGPVTKNALLQ